MHLLCSLQALGKPFYAVPFEFYMGIRVLVEVVSEFSMGTFEQRTIVLDSDEYAAGMSVINEVSPAPQTQNGRYRINSTVKTIGYDPECIKRIRV